MVMMTAEARADRDGSGMTAINTCAVAGCGVDGDAVAGRWSGTADQRLCFGCRDRFRADLLALPALYEECGHRLTGAGGRPLERVSGGLPGGISLDDSAASTRAQMRSVLASWAGLVVQQRAVSGPDRREVALLVAFLARHVDWLAEHPAAADAAEEIGRLARLGRAAARIGGPRSLMLGRCDEPGCDQPVHAELNPDRRPPRVSCAASHVWPPHKWLQLRRRMRLRPDEPIPDAPIGAGQGGGGGE